ncbi:glucose-1-phosphate adenylyltransferase subunit GlgD [Alkalihalobacillus oceani]|uniref:Glucose-1-phosphate adenylyltransferase subunit GlgD n=1 Tax=Halalkalibacter oceani TaxID=1653776 RepID=A0A9X2DLZ5_9BACI|nr:glucose-1-phosphate adenylyltransferase subunit GlgD [Halalkalibacter oceani]MCM3712585.1 glucose-1-phosphate adenylyltransferase subunit GlgD [Halalkalibacter oceani]
MNRLIGIIHLDKEQDFLNELTAFRCGAAVPFGGRYRVIDFVLSNMANARIKNILIFAQQKYRSLVDHVATGKAWNLERKRGGLSILPPDWHERAEQPNGDLQHFHRNRHILERDGAEYVLLTGTQHICTIDYENVFYEHLHSGHDVTVVYQPLAKQGSEHENERKLVLTDDGLVSGAVIDPANRNVYMGMLILKKSLLLELVDDCLSRNRQSFFEGIIAHLERLTVGTYRYTDYLSVINSIESYYKHSMALLEPATYKELFHALQTVYTKGKDEPPARFGTRARTSGSLIANGCIIEGTVENSILFGGVHVKPHASVRNSIIMQRSTIHEGSHVSRIIADKDAHITSKRIIRGTVHRPYVIAKRKVM